VKFGYTIIYVKDVVQTVDFYEKAFGLTRRFIHESQQYAEMETGATTLAFASNEMGQANFPTGFQENSPGKPPAGIEIALVTGDVIAAYDRSLSSGALAQVPPEVKPWGQQVAYVRDLNGVLVEIASPLD